MRFDHLEVELVSDGVVYTDAGGPFGLVPRSLYKEHITPDADNKLPMALTCMLVRSRGKTILIDTGLGDKLTPAEAQQWGSNRSEGGLHKALSAKGVSPSDIDIVVNTHLHSDHCGGNTRLDGGEIVASFPRAEYWVQRIEWAEASHPDARTQGTYFDKNFTPLMGAGKVRLLHGDTEITDEAICVVTPGHTRGHQSVLLRAGTWHGLYLGDMASYSIHFERTSWLTAYDVLPLENIATKMRWQEWALETSAWLFFEHDPSIHVARLFEHNGRQKIERELGAQPLIDSLPKPLLPHE